VRVKVSVAVLAVVVMVVLGVWPPPVLERGIGDGTRLHTLLMVLLLPTQSYVLIPVIAVTVGVCALRKRWRDTAFCAAGIAVPIAVNEVALKPLFHHPLHGYLAYPSGHTVSLVSTLTVLVLLARQRTLAAVAAALVTVAAGIGLVGFGFHSPNDVVGGACFAVAAVLTLSLAMPRGRAPSAGSPRAGTSSGSRPAASPR
jgi:membrane-associated phospholipid phosphatase